MSESKRPFDEKFLIKKKVLGEFAETKTILQRRMRQSDCILISITRELLSIINVCILNNNLALGFRKDQTRNRARGIKEQWWKTRKTKTKEWETRVMRYKRNQHRKLIKLHPAAEPCTERYTRCPFYPLQYARRIPTCFAWSVVCLDARRTPSTHSVSPSLGDIEKKLW